MGLDMSIYKKKHVSDNWDEIHKATKAGEKAPKLRHEIVETEMLYLRKANAIHRYIVDKFGDGEDNCQEIWLTIDNLKELKELCDKVVAKSKLATTILNGGNGYESRVKDELVAVLEKVDGVKKYFKQVGKKRAEDVQVGDIIASRYDGETKDGFKWGDEVKTISVDGDRVCMTTTQWYVGKGIVNSELAEELLPTQAGFIFGSTAYDEYYIDDLKSCSEQIAEIIDDYNAEIASGVRDYDISYYYLASW